MFAPAERAGLTAICNRCGTEGRIPGEVGVTSLNRPGEKSETLLDYRSRKIAPPALKWRPSRWTVIILISCAIGYLLMLLVAMISPKDTTYEQEQARHMVVTMFWVGVWIATGVLGVLYGLRLVLKYQPKVERRATSIDSIFNDVSDTPGTFEVRGVNRETQTDAVQKYEAQTPANAKIKAELEGMIVSSVRRISNN
jgi:hypothetical protein